MILNGYRKRRFPTCCSQLILFFCFLFVLVSCNESKYTPGPNQQTAELIPSETDSEGIPEPNELTEASETDNDETQNLEEATNNLPDPEQQERISKILNLVENYDNGPREDRTSVEQLVEWIENREEDTLPLYIVDARFIEEFEVSHLPGAYHQDEFREKLRNGLVPSNARVVTYCTIGFRSSFFTQDLKENSLVAEVWNLEGSILMWVNKGKSVYTIDQKKSKSVHVYDDRWNVLPPEYNAVTFPGS